MSTTLMWKALDSHGHFYSKIWAYPVYWNIEIGGLSFEKDTKRLAVWYFVVFGVVLLAYVGSSTFPFGMWIFHNKAIPLLNAAMLTIFMFFGIFYCSVSYAVICHGESTTKAFNHLRVIEKELNELKNQKGRRNIKPKVDWMGLTFNALVLINICYPPFLAIFAVLGNIDPLYFVLEGLFHVANQHIIFKLVALISRFVIFLVASTEICRLLPLLLIALAVGLQMYNNCINILKERTRSNQFNSTYSFYLRIKLVILLKSRLTDVAIVALMLVGFLLSIGCNFLTVKGASIIPMPFYLYFPSLSILIPLTISFTLPYATNVHEGSVELLRIWKRNILSGKNRDQFKLVDERRIDLKRLNALRTLSFYAGVSDHRFFVLKNSTRSTFNSSIVDYTITALLSIHVEAVNKLKNV